MNWSDIDLHPNERKLRQFSLLWFCLFAGLAAWRAGHGQAHSGTLLLIGIAVGGIGLVRPALIRSLYVTASVVAFPIGWLTSRLILAIAFYGIFTPLALMFKIIGRDALRRKAPEPGSLWREKKTSSDVSEYLQPF